MLQHRLIVVIICVGILLTSAVISVEAVIAQTDYPPEYPHVEVPRVLPDEISLDASGPVFEVYLDYGRIELKGFAAETLVELVVIRPGAMVPYFTQEKKVFLDSEKGVYVTYFDVAGLGVNDTVVVNEKTIVPHTYSYKVPDLRITAISLAADIVGYTGTIGDGLLMQLMTEKLEGARFYQAPVMQITQSPSGQSFEGIYDIVAGTLVTVVEDDAATNFYTIRMLPAPNYNPHLRIVKWNRSWYVDGMQFRPEGGPATLRVAQPGSSVYDITAEDFQCVGFYCSSDYRFSFPIDQIQDGARFRLNDTFASVAEMTIPYLEVDWVDYAAKTVRGRAPAGMKVSVGTVCLDFYTPVYSETTTFTVGPSGTWAVELTNLGPEWFDRNYCSGGVGYEEADGDQYIRLRSMHFLYLPLITK